MNQMKQFKITRGVEVVVTVKTGVISNNQQLVVTDEQAAIAYY